jgi:hypothetical protein
MGRGTWLCPRLVKASGWCRMMVVKAPEFARMMVVKTLGSRRTTVVKALGIGLMLALGTTAVAAPAVKGDAAAWSAIVAAEKKLRGLVGYRIRVSVSDGTTATGDFSPPNLHWLVLSKDGTSEIFVVGNKSAIRHIAPGAAGGVLCRIGTDIHSVPFPEPTDRQGELTVTRKDDTVIDGVPVHLYDYTMVVNGVQVDGEMYLGIQSGLPRRTVETYATNSGLQTTTKDYFDYGVKVVPPITLPQC